MFMTSNPFLVFRGSGSRLLRRLVRKCAVIRIGIGRLGELVGRTVKSYVPGASCLYPANVEKENVEVLRSPYVL